MASSRRFSSWTCTSSSLTFAAHASLASNTRRVASNSASSWRRRCSHSPSQASVVFCLTCSECSCCSLMSRLSVWAAKSDSRWARLSVRSFRMASCATTVAVRPSSWACATSSSACKDWTFDSWALSCCRFCSTSTWTARLSRSSSSLCCSSDSCLRSSSTCRSASNLAARSPSRRSRSACCASSAVVPSSRTFCSAVSSNARSWCRRLACSCCLTASSRCASRSEISRISFSCCSTRRRAAFRAVCASRSRNSSMSSSASRPPRELRRS
mmetsp:Transcript_35855/g.64072  ORF Transcript_35855/g.64072 Transcript_35855/m.64072 type:complete len:270 (-) Transcript_35855:368-1177(-)